MSAMRSMPTDAGLMQLQQEALARVRQMQQRARETVQNTDGFSTPSFAQMPLASSPPPVPDASVSPGFTPQSPAEQNAAPQGDARHDGAPQRGTGFSQGQNPGMGRPPFAQQRPNARAPQGDSILSQLFGGGRPQGNRPGNAQQTSNKGATPAASSGGLLDLIRGGLSGSVAPGLGDTLRGSIATASKPLSDLLDAFSIDGEKLLILLVMWVIFNERSDNKTLLLALGYLLL